jgi:hypothetical protein
VCVFANNFRRQKPAAGQLIEVHIKKSNSHWLSQNGIKEYALVGFRFRAKVLSTGMVRFDDFPDTMLKMICRQPILKNRISIL